MRTQALIGCWLLLVLLAGCSALQQPAAPPDAEAETEAQTETETEAEPQKRDLVPQMLAFADRLADADDDTLADMGDGLRRAATEEGSVEARLRYAYWRATPGHSGFDPESARRTLEDVLADADDVLAAPTQSLVRLQLRHLRRARAWRERHAELSRANDQLRDKIRELTDLERRMESDR